MNYYHVSYIALHTHWKHQQMQCGDRATGKTHQLITSPCPAVLGIFIISPALPIISATIEQSAYHRQTFKTANKYIPTHYNSMILFVASPGTSGVCCVSCSLIQ